MRPILIAPLLLLPLAGCGAADEAARNSFREASIQSCTSASRSAAPPQLAGWDWARICACATDRLMEGKSAADLARIESNTPEQRAAIQQCVTQVQGVTVPDAPGAPAPGAPAAPAEETK